MLLHTTYSEYFKQNVYRSDALDFLAELAQHIPPKRIQLILRHCVKIGRVPPGLDPNRLN